MLMLHSTSLVDFPSTVHVKNEDEGVQHRYVECRCERKNVKEKEKKKKKTKLAANRPIIYKPFKLVSFQTIRS